MKVGCVKEVKRYEFRVGLTPENAKQYILAGHTVYVQSGAGEGSAFTDAAYEAMGAIILPTAEEVWTSCDMIVKVKEPLAEEYDFLQEGQILYTYLHLASDRTLTEMLLHKKVKAVAYETIEDKHGQLPLLRPMSEVAGKLSIQVGARCLEKPMGGMGVLLGGVPGVKHANVVILGGGVVGVGAAKMAVGLGANVTILDNNMERLIALDTLFGQSVQTLYSTPVTIEQVLPEADLVIGAILVPGAAAAKLVRREHLSRMKPGSVIVDVAVDQGGCCETTRMTYHDNPTFVVDGVIHYGVANMPGAVSKTSTVALTNATIQYGTQIATLGLEAAAKRDPGLGLGVNCYLGHMTCEAVAKEFHLPYQPLSDLI
ncbi:MAG: alanine dehydrogenase [Oscillospiraceae bacterium]|nr:alanine dehydrogenase [Oscillospiraceae bacterium]